MRVILPILITALWAATSVDIEGFWQPAQPVDGMRGAVERIEAPAQAMLTQFQSIIDPSLNPKSQPLDSLEAVPNIHHQIKAVRIALPVMPRIVIPAPRSRPVCS